MERELFDWEGWDGETDCMTFYEPVLKVQIGDYPPGTKFDHAVLLHKEGYGILQLCNLGEKHVEDRHVWYDTKLEAEFKIHYRVGEKIS